MYQLYPKLKARICQKFCQVQNESQENLHFVTEITTLKQKLLQTAESINEGAHSVHEERDLIAHENVEYIRRDNRVEHSQRESFNEEPRENLVNQQKNERTVQILADIPFTSNSLTENSRRNKNRCDGRTQ